ncbi:MAG: rhamnogalacturonan acetylesterase [Terracidiphilus sp.]
MQIAEKTRSEARLVLPDAPATETGRVTEPVEHACLPVHIENEFLRNGRRSVKEGLVRGRAQGNFRGSVIVIGLLLALGARATGGQAPATTTESPATPAQQSRAVDAPLNPALPTLFIVADSTARNQADLGWGDHLAHYFDTTRINLANRAIAGRSSRSYIREGAWDRVMAEMKPGDFVLLQMGHNDGGDLDGAKPRGSLKGLGEETKDVTLLDGTKETVHTYGWYMRKYIADSRAKQVTPILLSLTVRNIWTPGPDGSQHIERDMGYDAAIRQLADEQHVAFVDMGTIEADRLEAMGPAKTALLFPIDHTHTSAEGAEMNAECVAQALRKAQSPLVAYLAK